MNNTYAIVYFVCDILNFINTVGQMYFINLFLGGVFLTYGTDVLYWADTDPESRTDPLVEVFPRLAKCTFYKYGSSGTIGKFILFLHYELTYVTYASMQYIYLQRVLKKFIQCILFNKIRVIDNDFILCLTESHDALCLLALNIISEKIYVFLWFWLITLAVLTAVYLIYQFAVVLIPGLRQTMLERNAKTDYRDRIDILMKKANIGDWFVLFLLSKNLDSILFREFISQLSEKLKTEPQDDLIWDTDPSQVLLQVRRAPFFPLCLHFQQLQLFVLIFKGQLGIIWVKLESTLH